MGEHAHGDDCGIVGPWRRALGPLWLPTGERRYAYSATGRELKKRKIKKKGTYDVEVDGKTYQVKGKKVEKRGGRVTKFKAKGEGDGFKIKIKDKLKKSKSGLVKKDKKQSKYK